VYLLLSVVLVLMLLLYYCYWLLLILVFIIGRCDLEGVQNWENTQVGMIVSPCSGRPANYRAIELHSNTVPALKAIAIIHHECIMGTTAKAGRVNRHIAWSCSVGCCLAEELGNRDRRWRTGSVSALEACSRRCTTQTTATLLSFMFETLLLLL